MARRSPLTISLTPISRGSATYSPSTGEYAFGDPPFYLVFRWADASQEIPMGSWLSERLHRRRLTRIARQRTMRVIADGAERNQFIRTAFFGHRVPPHLMASYSAHSWFDDEATSWAVLGITANDAIAWKRLGLIPAEAVQLKANHASPDQIATQWQSAGIPENEIADWLGAGLTPAEAARQRANGVTREYAAALRSLRKR